MFCKTQILALTLLVLCQPSNSFRRKNRLALKEEAETPEGYLPICAKEIVKETCGLLHGGFTKENAADAMSWLRVDTIKEVLSAHEDSIAGLWKALGIPAMPSKEALEAAFESEEVKSNLQAYGLKIMEEGDEKVLNIACEEVCYLVRDYVDKNFVLPPASDMMCMVEEGGSIKCDIDVRPATLGKLHRGGDMPELHEGDVEQPDVKSLVEAELPANTSLPMETRNLSKIDYVVFEIVEAVAELFRFYPLLDPSREPEASASASLLQLSNGTQPSYSHAQAVTLGKKAIGYVNTVIREVQLGQKSHPHLKEWFGTDSADTKTETVRVLNSVKHVLKNVHYEYPGPTCGATTYAYVYPRAYDCSSMSAVRSQPCRTYNSKFIYYLCNVYVNSDDGAKIETLVHEGSHHYSAYTDDVCADRGHIYKQTPMSQCQSKAYGRNTCFDLATYSKVRALKNADSHCYFVQALADPVYHENQRCKTTTTKALTPFADEEGDCRCPTGLKCYQGSTQTCRSSAGYSDNWFLSTCTNCKCGGPAGSPTPVPTTKCHSSAAVTTPDSDGDCRCPSDKQCFKGSELGCPSSGAGASSRTYFVATCSTCTCKVAPSTPSNPTPTPSSGAQCPASAKSLTPDLDGDCDCGMSKVCRNNGVENQCPYSSGTSGRYFFASCTTCSCHTKGSGSAPTPPGQCPSFAKDTEIDRKGDCRCASGKYCYRSDTNVQCLTTGGSFSYFFFSSTCVTCQCKLPGSGPDALPPPEDDEEDDRDDNGVRTWQWPVLAILLNTFVLAS